MSLAQKGIHIEAKHIAGHDNKRADWLSRNTDRNNLRPRREVFLDVCRQFNFRPTGRTILFLANGLQEFGECVRHSLEATSLLAQSTLGAHSTGPQEAEGREGGSLGMPTSLAVGTLVGDISEHDDRSPNRVQRTAVVHKSRRAKRAPTSMGNPFHYGERLTSGQARSKLRTLECQQDIPTRQRLTWVRDALAVQEDPRTRAILRQGIKRLDRCGKSARYPMFYSLQPLLDMAFGGMSATSDTTNMGNHLDILLLQLRLTTMMRSADMANIAWAVFTQDDLHFVKTTDKTGAALTFSVTGDTLETLLVYIYRHRNCPAPQMFRYLKDPACCLGS